ncbi:alpha/beta fold hydrolase [Nakamurella flavida]|uniref:Alpha/beta fold hydrolase n=1 Tax=Nakamurella flavida TaxID=363630 RepID=A0A938YI12_9ACTN|nr:alpha/beta fold hydrolase [Nakamurella flavida]MBM9474986.1 alpha/beta fold hydrolase [Nakamurella flavida]MDP9776555.1 pimeloyl-ACP methyl ester carboxylesterase [Nakamurella flavida]
MADQLTPTAATRRTLPSPVGPLAALRADPPGDRAGAILLVPGYTGSKEDFAVLLDPLAAAGFTAVALDQPGQLDSPGPDDETAYTPDALGAVVAAVLADLTDELGTPPVLLGHSYGGLVSRAAVIGGARPAGLVLFCSGPGRLGDPVRVAALESGEPLMRAHGREVVFDAREAQLAAQGPVRSPELQAFHRRRFLGSSQAGLLGMGTALLVEPDRSAELAGVLTVNGIPVAVVAGDADDAWPLTAQAGMAATLGTELVIVPDAGHSAAADNPEGVLEVLVPLLRAWS